MVSAAENAHLEACLPEIATLDCGTMNFAEADYVMTTPRHVRIWQAAWRIWYWD